MFKDLFTNLLFRISGILFRISNDVLSDVRRIIIVGLIIVSISLSIKITNLRNDVKTLQENLIETNQKITEIELKFETFKTLTSKEFESTWRSFGRVRNNFLAFGLGFNLEDEDIAPEGYAIAKEIK